MSGRRGVGAKPERQALASRRAEAARGAARYCGSGRQSIVAEEPDVVDFEDGIFGHIARLDKEESGLV